MRSLAFVAQFALLGIAAGCAQAPTLSTDAPRKVAAQSNLKNLAKAEARASEVVRLSDYKLIATEETPQLMGQRSGMLQMLGTVRTFVGDLDGSMSAMTAVFTPGGRSIGKPLTAEETELVENSTAEDAIAAIVRAAKSRQIVILNEAHHIPMHRAFAMRLARELRKLGFTHLACEGFAPIKLNGNLSAARPLDLRYPVLTSGTLIQEPHFGEFIRDAARDGWQFFAYEDMRNEQGLSPRDSIISREEGQAQNLIDNIFARDPNAKVFIYAGYSHAAKTALPYRSESLEWMAARLKRKTGIDPLTIDQTTQYAVPGRLGETRVYRALLAKHKMQAPFVLRDAKEKSIIVMQPREAFDFQVVYPDYSAEPGIQAWRRTLAGRNELTVPDSLLPSAGRRLIYAFVVDESSEAVPVDVVLLEVGKPPAKLMLPPGKYRIEYEDE